MLRLYRAETPDGPPLVVVVDLSPDGEPGAVWALPGRVVPIVAALRAAPPAQWRGVVARLVADGHHLPGETLAAMFASHALLVALAQERRPGASIEEALEVVVGRFAEPAKRAAAR